MLLFKQRTAPFGTCVIVLMLLEYIVPYRSFKLGQ